MTAKNVNNKPYNLNVSVVKLSFILSFKKLADYGHPSESDWIARYKR
jgi:hypothetical protein